MALLDISKKIGGLRETEYESTFKKLKQMYNRTLLDIIFYDKYNYMYGETMEEREKRRDYKFKKDVKDRYKKCIITGKSIKICEVAHIVAFRDASDMEKYDVNNGLILCCELHKLFDTKDKLLQIDADTLCIKFKKEILEDEGYVDYHKYHNMEIKVDLNDETIRYLRRINKN
jgi:predicted restriction endonuclease